MGDRFEGLYRSGQALVFKANQCSLSWPPVGDKYLGRASALFAGVELRCLVSQSLHTTGFRIDDPHVVPIVRELFAATQADKVGPSNRCDLGTRLALAASNELRAFLMAAAKDLGPGKLK
jgi:hypothetical protein